MDGKVYAERPKNPREGANPLSSLTFAYILRLFWVGYRRDLDIQDLYEPLKEHTSNRLGEQIAKLWEEECQRVNKKQLSKRKGGERGKDGDDPPKKEPSLLRVLMKCFGAKLFLYGILLAIMEILLRLLQPLFLSLLVGYFRVKTMIPIHARVPYSQLDDSRLEPTEADDQDTRSLSAKRVPSLTPLPLCYYSSTFFFSLFLITLRK